jgi:hypothetical protein
VPSARRKQRPSRASPVNPASHQPSNQNEYRKRSVQVRNGECGVCPNLISVIAKHRAPRPVKLMLASRLPIVSAVFHWASRRFGRSAACPKPQRVRTHGPPGKFPASTARHPLRVGTTRAPPNRPSQTEYRKRAVQVWDG